MKLISIALTLLLAAPLSGAAQQLLPYQNTSLTPEQRATDLLERLTLEEKVSLMQNKGAEIERLGIREYDWWSEGLHGVARNGTATVFPQCIGMAATFDNALIQEVFNAVSDEARAKYTKARNAGKTGRYQGLTFWTPNVNIFRDPRWGRGQETYGEDPWLTSQMGLACVAGLQGPKTYAIDKLHACAKHFAVHSGPEWNRHSFNAENIKQRDLYETYLPAFKDLVQKGHVKEVMCAYNRLEGEPCCGSNRLLTHILRNEWGFDGIVTSDCAALRDFYAEDAHHTHKDAADASAAAVLSGTDIECGAAYGHLIEAVKQGYIREEQIDISVKRILKARFELGLMDNSTPWDQIPYSVVDGPAHRQLNLKTALESIVLLQNKKNILPLKKSVKVALIGPAANDSVMQWGNYNGFPGRTITLLNGLRNMLPADHIIYEPAIGYTEGTVFESIFPQCRDDHGASGFTATYWNNKNRKGKPATTVAQRTPMDFTTQGATAFAAGVELQNFSATYHTKLTATEKTRIDVKAQVKGRLQLVINGKNVKSRNGEMASTETIYSWDVEPGQEYDIEVRYTATADGGALKFDLGTPKALDFKQLMTRIKKADVVIYAGGISPALEGEEKPVNIKGFKGGDRTDIQLPDVQRELLAAIAKTGKKIIFIHFSGCAMGMVPETNNCQAIVQCFYPGAEGGTALSKVLFGDYNPAGRLPITFYRDCSQLPGFEDYNMANRTYRYFKGQALYPFGYGLSYTTFQYGKATISDGEIVIPVSNIGKQDGDEVVQLYVKRLTDTEGPLKTLRAFRRVHVKAGITENVKIPLNDETFLWWDENTNSMRSMPGEFRLYYGGSSDDAALRTETINRK